MKKVVPLHDDLFDFFYEALPGYEEVGRRRVLLGCWGSFNDPDVCDYTYQNMTRLGPGDVRHARRRRGWRAGHDRPGRHQPRTSASCSAARSTTTGPARARCSSRRTRSATRSISAIRGTRRRSRSRRSATSTASTPGSCRRAGSTSGPASTWRSTPAAGRSPGSGRRRWRGSSTSATSRRPGRA